jgi:hypothetical protein
VNVDATHLVGVGGYGVSHEDVALFSRPLSDRLDPLVRVLHTGQPAVFHASRTNRHTTIPSTPLRTSGFLALPLPAPRGKETEAVGLLLVRASTPVTADLNWLLRVLGQRIGQIRGRGGVAEETRTLLHHLVWNDRNFMELLTADYSFLTTELAEMYGLPAPKEQFEMVKFPADSNRAGILGQGTFLASTAGPTDTSPTARGKLSPRTTSASAPPRSAVTSSSPSRPARTSSR